MIYDPVNSTKRALYIRLILGFFLNIYISLITKGIQIILFIILYIMVLYQTGFYSF